MSQTEKLLRNLTGSTVLNTAEGHFVIGKDRVISVPNKLKRIAVQNDHNIETVTFDCPRYWDGQDMSKMAIYINYIRSDKESGKYQAVNVIPDKRLPDTMHFDWTITKNVSLVAGKIAFQVCINRVDEDGNEVVHWNSEVCNDCYVTESLDCSGEDIVETYPDVLIQWRDSGEFDGPPGVSPIIEIVNIQGGHRVTITDVNGTQYFDVMDTFIENSDAVAELLNRYAVVSEVEPSAVPAIWFELQNALKKSGPIKVKNTDGTTHVFYPHTLKENVLGIDSIEHRIDTLQSYFVKTSKYDPVLDIEHGGTGASNPTDARQNLGVAAFNHTHDELAAFKNGIVKIQNGGTGASDAETARANLGAASAEQVNSIRNFFNADGEVYKLAVQNCDNTDLNTLTNYGIYRGYTGMVNSAVDTAGLFTILEVVPFNPQWLMQRQTVLNPNDPSASITYVRYMSYISGWTPWRRMLTNVLHPDDYGPEFPANAVKGQIFFKKVVV